MTAIPTSLSRWQPEAPADAAHIRAMAAAAWHQTRPWVCIPLDEIRDPATRRGVEAEMIMRHGRRKPQGGR